MGALILHDDTGKRQFDIQESHPIFIGRIRECEICLPSPTVSRQHAVLVSKNGVCGVKDLGSANGTYVNGKRIEKSVRLINGDIVQVAEFTFEFTSDEPASTLFMEGSPLTELREYSPEPRTSSSANREASRRKSFRASRANEVPAGPPTTPKVEHDDYNVAEAPETSRPASKRVAKPASVRLNANTPPPGEATPPRKTPESEGDDGPIDSPSDDLSISMPAANTELGDGDEPEEADSPGERRQKEERVLRAVADTRVRYIDDEDESGTDTPESLPVDDDAVVKRQEALTRAAAETGIVGEFVPDVEEEAQEAEEKSAILRVPLSPALKQAIDSRMSLYTLLNDLACARAEFIASHPKLAEAVVNEFARQERERSKMPSAEQANAMRSKRAARRADLKERIKKARSTGDEPPPLPPKHMTEAEQMADSQWSIIANSEEKALPKVIEAAFEQCRDEPLAKDLAAVKIDPSFIMGGGLYYLALENILESAQTRRKAVKGMLASAAPEKKSGFRLFAAREEDEDDDSRVDPPKLQEEDEAIASSIAALNQELADIEKRLIKEFWSVYVAAALHYIPRYENMPWSVRAYLRHGAVGYAAWWMPEHVREHVYRDCTEEVLHGWDDSEATTHILYADEYLRAVAELDCTPALDENLELNERNSPNWKADKALRKLIFSSTQIKLLGGLLESTDEKLAGLQNEHDQFAQEAAKILHGAKNEKQNRRDLQQKQQSVKVEMSKLKKLAEKIRSQTLSQMREAVADTEKRFDDGELPRPPVDFLVRRECDAVHKIARLLANLKERFMPLVVRDYKPDTDALDDRPSVNGEIAEIERRDPAVFLETLVPAKRKKDRVDLRVSPTIVILPSAGLLAYAWNPRGGPENGRLAVPTCFIRQRLRERQMTYLFADFRWDTSKASAGMDLMTSDTIVAAFMTVRWDWRKRSREAREKGLIFNDQNDRTNWRRVYEAYIQTAMDSGKKLYNRNYDFYERIIGRYFDLPEGLPLLKK